MRKSSLDAESGESVRLLVVDDVGLPAEIRRAAAESGRLGIGVMNNPILSIGSFSLIRALHMGHRLLDPCPP